MFIYNESLSTSNSLKSSLAAASISFLRCSAANSFECNLVSMWSYFWASFSIYLLVSCLLSPWPRWLLSLARFCWLILPELYLQCVLVGFKESCYLHALFYPRVGWLSWSLARSVFPIEYVWMNDNQEKSRSLSLTWMVFLSSAPSWINSWRFKNPSSLSFLVFSCSSLSLAASSSQVFWHWALPSYSSEPSQQSIHSIININLVKKSNRMYRRCHHWLDWTEYTGQHSRDFHKQTDYWYKPLCQARHFHHGNHSSRRWLDRTESYSIHLDK